MPVNAIAGWIASGIAPAAIAGARMPTPWSGLVCTTSCPGCHMPASASPSHESDELVVRHREQHELAPFDERRRLEDGHAGQERLGTVDARLGQRGDPDDGVLGVRQGRAEDRSDPARSDDPDAQASGPHRTAPGGGTSPHPAVTSPHPA